jgi:hypothetical protein
MLAELNTLPTNSPASGFTYRLDPELGANVRSSSNFGPFFMDRSLTAGKGQMSFGIAMNDAVFDNIDGRPLADGTLVATAARLVADPQPFDTETLTIRIRTQTLTILGHIGVADRVDVSAAVPVVAVGLDGTRLNTYRGTSVVQATASATSSGLGDVRFGAKYGAVRRGGSGLSIAGEVKLPTGDTDNLRGTGYVEFTPRVIGSWERDRVALHGNLGYAIGQRSDEVEYAGGLAIAAHGRFTVMTELMGRRIASGGRLVNVVESHPDLAGVETIRLSSTRQATTQVQAAAGFRWNVATTWLVSVNLLRPLTTAGLNAGWMTSVVFDYTIGD